MGPVRGGVPPFRAERPEKGGSGGPEPSRGARSASTRPWREEEHPDRTVRRPGLTCSPMREERPDLGLAHVIDPREAHALELDDILHFQGGHERLAESSGFRSVRQDEVHIDPVRDPLDLRDVLVLQRDETRPMVQDDVAEVLKTHLLAAELLEIPRGDVDLWTHR